LLVEPVDEGQVSLAEVRDLAGFTPSTRRGNHWRGACPLHRARNAASRSFAAHLGKGVWHCFEFGPDAVSVASIEQSRDAANFSTQHITYNRANYQTRKSTHHPPTDALA
jgi:hypothetical protein